MDVGTQRLGIAVVEGTEFEIEKDTSIKFFEPVDLLVNGKNSPASALSIRAMLMCPEREAFILDPLIDAYAIEKQPCNLGRPKGNPFGGRNAAIHAAAKSGNTRMSNIEIALVMGLLDILHQPQYVEARLRHNKEFPVIYTPQATLKFVYSPEDFRLLNKTDSSGWKQWNLLRAANAASAASASAAAAMAIDNDGEEEDEIVNNEDDDEDGINDADLRAMTEPPSKRSRKQQPPKKKPTKQPKLKARLPTGMPNVDKSRAVNKENTTTAIELYIQENNDEKQKEYFNNLGPLKKDVADAICHCLLVIRTGLANYKKKYEEGLQNGSNAEQSDKRGRAGLPTVCRGYPIFEIPSKKPKPIKMKQLDEIYEVVSFTKQQQQQKKQQQEKQ